MKLQGISLLATNRSGFKGLSTEMSSLSVTKQWISFVVLIIFKGMIGSDLKINYYPFVVRLKKSGVILKIYFVFVFVA